MGNKGSLQGSRDYQNLIEQFDVLQENQNEGLRYLEHKDTKQEFLLREISCHDKEAFANMEMLLRSKMPQLENNRHVVPLLKLISDSQDQYCMTFYKLYALFAFPQRTLDDEINERNLQKRRFQQKELWSILASCILGMSHLQKHGIKHSTLKSSSILISHDGIIKIYDPIATGAPTNYVTLLSHRFTPHLYISPEQTSTLAEERVNANWNPFKSDIWTLGMIILEAGLLSYQDECYRDQWSRVHWETLQYNLSLFQQHYTAELTNLVEFMLSRDERSRPDWFELQEHVIKVEEDGRASIISDTSNQVSKELQFMPRKSQANPPQMKNSTVSIGKNAQTTTPTTHLIGNRHTDRSSTSRIGISRSKVQDHRPTPHSSMVQRQNLPQIPISAPIQSIPSRVSDISLTRPQRNTFPTAFYTTHTKIDQNLVLLTDQERDSQIDDSLRFNNTRFEQPFKQNFSPFQPFSNRVVSSVPIPVANSPPSQVHQTVYYNPPSIIGQPTLSQSVRPPLYTKTSVPIASSIVGSTLPKSVNQGQYVVEYYKQGSRYEGYKLNSLKHGFGKFYYQDGGLYEGHWKNGKMEGHGKLYYQSDRLAYEGEWLNDQFSGKGTLYNEFPEPLTDSFNYRNFDEIEQYWTKYEGQFQEDMKHGWGVLFLSNGEYFEGEFKSDYADGMGTFSTNRGNKIRGRWHCNVME